MARCVARSRMQPYSTNPRSSILSRALKQRAILAIAIALTTAFAFGIALRSVIRTYVIKETSEIASAFAVEVQIPLIAGDEAEMERIVQKCTSLRDVLFFAVTDNMGNSF